MLSAVAGPGVAVEIRTDGASLPAYRVAPPTGRGPGVLVLHEAFGLVDWVRGVCERLARAGFVALAPDLYRGQSADSIEGATRLALGLAPDGIRRDLAASVTALFSDHAVDGPRVGAVGFCMGGHLALLAAEASPRVAAAVDFYGLHPGLPVDPGRIRGAVLGIFAERDEFVPAESVEALRRSLEQAGVRASFVVQPGVGHAFMNEMRPERFDARAAAEGWDRLLAFLRAELP
jgi:carboxymethylenebutenolidase